MLHAIQDLRLRRPSPTGLAGLIPAMLLALAVTAGAAEVGNAARGEVLYGQCLACHSLDRDRTGPRHCGLVGRLSGSVPGFEYSKGMKDARILWGPETLDAFLADPDDLVPGTSMYYRVESPSDRKDLIAWLMLATAREGRCTVNEDNPP